MGRGLALQAPFLFVVAYSISQLNFFKASFILARPLQVVGSVNFFDE